MKPKLLDSYELAVFNLPLPRAQAAIEAYEKFCLTPDAEDLKLRPVFGAEGFFLITTRQGDVLLLRQDALDVFAAVDVGPYARVTERIGGR